MKDLLLKYFSKYLRTIHPRTRRAQQNTILGLLIRGSGMAISFLLVPLTIDYLTKDAYGIWLTVSSVTTMIAIFDIGIGNGLRNKLPEAISQQDVVLARSYVSTAYIVFGTLQLLFFCLFLLTFRYVPWQKVFNTTIDNDQLMLVVLITIIATAIKLVLDIVSYVLLAIQESSWINIFNFLSNTFILIGTYILTLYTNKNLLYLTSLTSISPILILWLSSIILYKKKLELYRPSFKLFNTKYVRSLLSIGYKFFIIQIAVAVLFYTDNIIITQLFGPSDVTNYNISFRYFNLVTTLFTISITPYWSAFTEAYIQKDLIWMRRVYNNLQRGWLTAGFAVILMILVAKLFYFNWIGNRAQIPFILNLAMGLSVLIVCWNNVTVSVINGLGKIKIQLLCSIFAALSNIPLAIYLSKVINLGVTGVILATCVSLLPSTITGTIQAKRLVSGSAKGIWAS